ncbi:MAG: glycosyltransferase family 4 protein [Spirulina sp. SIO3F2]|nr:glycosyltransferase family 4 protein [Spirulina sp. SIO3F2]
MIMKDKHILAISSVYPLTPDGNHGAFIREVIIRLQSTGARFTVFAPAYEGSKSYVLEGVTVHRFRYCPKPFENLVRDGAPTKIQRQPLYLIAAALYIVLGTFQLFWLCLRERPNLLHVNWPFPHGLMALPASKLLGIPMVFSFYGGELLLAKKFPFVATMLRWLLPVARQVTVISSFTQGLVRKLAISKTLTLIPYGLTIEAKPAKVRQSSEVPKLLFVGRLDERKGVRYLLDALPLILAEEQIELRIVGKGILEAELQAQCQSLGLDEVVDFLGFVTKEELAEEYATCDIFVLPAIVDSKGDTEGLGIVMIEALAHAKPVVATAVGGIPDVITPEVTGKLVPEKNPEALANAIVNLLRDPQKAAAMGQQGLLDIQDRFNWDRIIPLWQNVFNQALD